MQNCYLWKLNNRSLYGFFYLHVSAGSGIALAPGLTLGGGGGVAEGSHVQSFQNSPNQARVKLAGSDVSGTVDAAAWPTAPDQPVTVRLDDGREFRAPRQMFHRQADGSFELALGHTDLARLTAALGSDAKDVNVIPIVAEEVQVGKRTVETGRVRVTKVVREQEQVVDQPLLREEVTVERVPVNRTLEGPVEVRTEGDTLVIPLVEEVVVIEKRLVLKEEVRVARRAVQVREPQTVTVRSEDVKIERTEGPGSGGDGTVVAKGSTPGGRTGAK